ncbi:MAG: DUF6515 family protein, partial [Sediminibacterium sp.]|nr:DUF6515 family protein [Sediminibacterium sp.]
MKKLFILFSIVLISTSLIAQRGGRGVGGPRFYNRNVYVHNTFVRNTRVDIVHPREWRTYPALPFGYRTYEWRGANIYFHDGFFYNSWNNQFRIMSCPIGFQLDFLPEGYVNVNFGGIPYFYLNGIFYREVNKKYVVQEPPIGAIVNAIPLNDAEKITVNGEQLLEVNNYLYKPIVNPTNNSTNYEVVGKYDNETTSN